MSLNTATKMRFARGLYRVVKGVQRLAGSAGDVVEVRRAGLLWRLDLSEGIDLSIFLFGRFERATSVAIRSCVERGMVVFDIGANIGAHALPMAQLVGPLGHVYGFEPTQWAYERLVENRELNEELKSSLSAVHAGLGRPGHSVPSQFYASWNVNATNNSVHKLHRGSLRSVGAAQSLTIDQAVDHLSGGRLNFIKLDVDGYETDVLAGGSRVLAKLGPTILFELCPHALLEHGTTAMQLLETLRPHGYRVFQLDGSPFDVGDESEIGARVPAGGSINLIARR